MWPEYLRWFMHDYLISSKILFILWLSHFQLGQQAELEELSNSILIEISKTAVTNWQEKLKTRYGWFKSDNCKHIIFDVNIQIYFNQEILKKI